jgi:hypothetical protein
MIRSKFFRFSFCLLVVISLFNPVALLAQQFPSSTTLEVNVGQDGQITGVVRTLEPGPNVADLSAFFTGQLVSPIPLAGPPEITVVPLFDREEFPNGPSRTTFKYNRPVRIPAGRSFLPGLVGFIVPARLGQMFTPESFLNSMLVDYQIEENGFKFMDSDLLKTENIVTSGAFDGALVGIPGQMVYIWGLNVTQKVSTPGTIRIRNIMKLPKTIPIPEFGLTYPGGELIFDVTVVIE